MSKGNLILKTATWERESHGLFDYESRSMLKRKITLNEPAWVLRQGDTTTSVSLSVQSKLEEGTKYLASVSVEGSSYVVNRCIVDKSIVDPAHCEKLWVVVKSLQTGYRISAGDIIRLGRVRMRVNEIGGLDYNLNLFALTPLKTRQITLGGLNPPKLHDGKKNPLHVSVAETDTEEDAAVKQVCRICLCDVSDDSDPLISPCKCTGTMGLVHLKCLQHWFNSKISSRERSNSKSFSWKALECELCKLPYPEKIEVKGTYHSLVEIPKPEGSYIILEVFGKDRNTKTFHVISLLNKNNVRLGRGHDSDVRFFDDISVSRNHAFMKVSSNGLYLFDNESKFGTLVLSKRPIVVEPSLPLMFQSGRTLLEINLKKNSNWFGCFSCNKTKEKKRTSNSQSAR